MKRSFRFISATALAVACFSALPCWARLPQPIQTDGTVVFVDPATQTVVFKTAGSKKPFVLDWNKDTQFMHNGVSTSATALKSGVPASISYKRLSFRNPLLKNVIWGNRPLDLQRDERTKPEAKP